MLTKDGAQPSGANSSRPATLSYLSIVIPVYNEVQSLAGLDQELRTVLNGQSYRSEIIYVDDYSTDGSRELLLKLAADAAVDIIETHVLFLRRNYGQTAAMAAGFQASRGTIVIPLDADGQNNPLDIP